MARRQVARDVNVSRHHIPCAARGRWGLVPRTILSLAALCLGLTAPALAQSAAPTLTDNIRQNWLLFSVLGGVAVIAFFCFVVALINLQKTQRPSIREAAPPASGPLSGGVGSGYPAEGWQGNPGNASPGPWARSGISPAAANHNPSSYSDRLPVASMPQNGNGAAAGAGEFGRPVFAGGEAANGASPGGEDIMGNGWRSEGGVPPIPPFPATPIVPETPVPPPPAVAPPRNAAPAPVDVADVEEEQAGPSGDWGNTVWQGAPERSDEPPVAPEDVFMTGDDEQTIEGGSATLTVLPAYLEVVASGDPDRDQIGTRKKLYSMNNNPDFAIARPVNGQEAIANFIPLQSKRVSRNWEKQGKIVFEFGSGTYAVLNLGNPLHPDPNLRNMPLRLEGRPMEPGEKVTLRDGDRIQVGDVMLRFHVSSRSPATFGPAAVPGRAGSDSPLSV